MAKLNGLYIFVSAEDETNSIEVTEHPVEEGVDISDHTKRKAIQLSITGEIVGKNATSVKNKIKSMQQNATLCKYVGRTTLSKCLIVDFNPGYTVDIWGGCAFSMTLKEVRTASTSYKKPAAKKKQQPKKTGTQQTKKKSKVTYVYHKVKKGDTVWALVASSKAPYRNLKRPAINGKSYSACNWVIAKNPSAFSKKNDFRTLQIGKKIIVGQR